MFADVFDKAYMKTPSLIFFFFSLLFVCLGVFLSDVSSHVRMGYLFIEV